MKNYLILLVLLSACVPQSICFNETPRLVNEFYPNKTVSHLEGNIILTTCPIVVNSTERSSECFSNGKKLNVGCPKDKYCEVDMIQGNPLPLCKPR